MNARVGKTQRLADLECVDELPRSAIGKVLKRELRERYVRRTFRTNPGGDMMNTTIHHPPPLHPARRRRRDALAPPAVRAGLAGQADPHDRPVPARRIHRRDGAADHAEAAGAAGADVLVDNKPGANGIIGVDALAKSPPDGYTFAVVIAAHAANTTLYPKLPYDPRKDLMAVSLIGVSPLVAAANNDAPFKTAARADRLRAQEPRQGQLRLQRQRLGGAPDHRVAEGADADEWSTSPTKARRPR